MKNVMFTLMMVVASLIVSGCNESAMTAWGLAEQNINTDDNAIEGRIGIRGKPGTDYSQIEGFAGTAWRPKSKYPSVVNVGAVYHWEDLIDPNNPLPWIPDILLLAIPEGWFAEPYLGGIFSANVIDRDAGYYAGIIGLEIKAEETDKVSMNMEGEVLGNYFKDLQGLEDDWRLKFGFYIRFP